MGATNLTEVGVIQNTDAANYFDVRAETMPREELAAEVRAVFGFSRLGPVLEEAIGSAIDALLASGVIGEGGSGVTLRGCER